MNRPPAAQPLPYRTLLGLAVLLAGGWLLYALAPILSPFLLAAAMAYLCDPLVDRLERRRLSRTLGTVLVLAGLALVFAALVLILTPLFQAQARLLMQQIPGLVEWAGDTLLPWLAATFGIDLARDQAEILAWLRGHLPELTRLTPYLPRLAGGGLALLGFFVNLLLVPVVLFYLLRDWDTSLAHLATWLPDRHRHQVVGFVREIDGVLSQFVRGQVLVILVMALFYSLGLWLAGLNYALAVGLVAGILVFVPYLGVVVGVLLGTLAAWVQFGDIGGLLPVWGVFAVGQLLEGMLITPWLVGEKVGLHPVAVIFALMAFGQLLGFVGVLIAIPAAAVSLVALRHLKRQLD
ncbi:MAG TPA: AI-2E family transporter [Thiobacillaceae bacterium]|nr:AI-2E family transporter [Thiobacillaceae bacterium]HNU65255.1 AI-2E family transporter [Thiobacillaceae bacterium]